MTEFLLIGGDPVFSNRWTDRIKPIVQKSLSFVPANHQASTIILIHALYHFNGVGCAFGVWDSISVTGGNPPRGPLQAKLAEGGLLGQIGHSDSREHPNRVERDQRDERRGRTHRGGVAFARRAPGSSKRLGIGGYGIFCWTGGLPTSLLGW